MSSTTKDGDTVVNLMKSNTANVENIAAAKAHFNQGLNWQTMSLQATLYLQAGNQVWVQIGNEQNDEEVWLWEEVYDHFMHFTGHLLV